MLISTLVAYLLMPVQAALPRFTPEQAAAKVEVKQAGSIVQLNTRNIDQMPGYVVLNISNGKILSAGVVHVEAESISAGRARTAQFRLASGVVTRGLNSSISNVSCMNLFSGQAMRERRDCERMTYNFVMSVEEIEELASYYGSGGSYWTYQLDRAPNGTQRETAYGRVPHGSGGISSAEFAAVLIAAKRFLAE